jgi:RES domain-containing protein
VLVWRLARAPYAALDGEGGRRASARWHTRGRPIVYTASHLSLAVLELLVHIDPGEIPTDLVALTIDVPDDIRVETLDVGSLPADWRAPEHEACRRAGDAWLASLRTMVLRVPSAVVPEEHNFLLNPLHPDAARARVAARRLFTFDLRLLR